MHVKKITAIRVSMISLNNSLFISYRFCFDFIRLLAKGTVPLTQQLINSGSLRYQLPLTDLEGHKLESVIWKNIFRKIK